MPAGYVRIFHFALHSESTRKNVYSLTKVIDFFFPKMRHVVQFAVNQGIAVAGNLFYGLLCVRLLPVQDYAKFAIIFGFMGTLTVLMDSITTGTLAPLIGENIDDLGRIADYVASVRILTTRVFLFLAPVAALALLFILRKQHWGILTDLQIAAAVLAISWFARVGGTYSSVLLIRRDRVSYYRIQIMGSIGSFALLLLFWSMHRVNLYTCVLLNIAQVTVCAFGYFRRSYQILGTRGVPTALLQRAIVHLALPSVPSSVFYALQGQITLLLITLFGHSATSIANLGALARLGQILTFASQMNPVLIEPFFAKLRASQVRPLYLLAFFLAVISVSILTILAFLYPGVFLWILGPHYQELRLEAGLVVCGSSIYFLSGFLTVINTARRFVYWWSNIANIVLILLVQVLFILRYDLSTVRNLLKMNIGASLSSLAVCIAVGIYGFTFGPQKALQEGNPDVCAVD
uniref:Polysaccharide biosynthesis protein n=1 Tax=mine drainage metagenome TaxID=410659 RepID=E6PYQ2_9ZZZZ